MIVEDRSREIARSSSVFEYQPYDTLLPPQAVLRVTVYDSVAWPLREGVSSAAAGELLARGPGVAYVVEFPGRNPYPIGSRDATEFAARLMTRNDVAAAFRVLR